MRHSLCWLLASAVAAVAGGCDAADPSSGLDLALPASAEPPVPVSERGRPLSPFRSSFERLSPSPCLADGASVGVWAVVFGGYGCVRPEAQDAESWFALAPGAVGQPDSTRASLVVGPRQRSAFRLSLRLVADRPLRTGSPPNPWETAWVVWDYTDNDHFYYAILKPNGWEVGKRDPAYPGGQRFLATGTSPLYPMGPWYHVVIERASGRTSLSADGVTLTTFVDRERPYTRGRIGFYTEDAAVRFSDVALDAAG